MPMSRENDAVGGMKLTDFVVRIEVAEGQAHPQVHIDSPAGQVRCPLPLDVAQIEGLLPGMGLRIRGEVEGARDLKGEGGLGREHSPQEIGAQLYQGLFGGTAGRFLAYSRGRLQGTSGLRIKLCFDLE